MAYTRPTRWSHGDIPDETDMQAYSDSLDAIYAIVGDAKINPAQLWSYENVDGTGFAGSDYYIQHRFRYLVYRSDASGNGEIVDPTGANPSTSPADSGATTTTYDLNQISWLTPGRLYQLKDFIFAYEDDSP